MLYYNTQPILADVAPTGDYTSNFDYCIKIINLERYPKYLFLIDTGSANSNLPTSGYWLVKPNQCTSLTGYRPVAKIAALAKNKVQLKDLKQINAGKGLKNTQLEKALIPANLIIDRPTFLPLTYQGKKIEARVKIESLDRHGLVIKNLDTSPPSLNWIVFPILGLTIVGWMLGKRQIQPGRSK
jgi:hypothetical protein